MVTWRAGLGPCSWRRAPCLLERDFCACACGDASPHGRKSRSGESWIFAYSRRHFSSSRGVSVPVGDYLHCANRSLLFKSFISRCMACSSSRFWDMWLPTRVWPPTRVWLLLVCVVSMLPSQNLPFSSFLPCSGFGKLPCCWDLVSSG